VQHILLKDKISKFIILIYSIIPITIVAGSFLFELNLFVIILTLIYYLYKEKRFLEEITNNNFFQIFIILWLYLLLNILISADFSLSIIRNFFFIKFLFVIISFKFFLNDKYLLNKILLTWTVILSIISFDVIFEFIMGHNLVGFTSPMPNERVVSFFKDELIVGGYILAFYFPIIGFQLYKKKIFIAFLLGLLFTVAILLSGERSSFFKLLLALFLFILFVLKNNKYKIILFLLLTSLITTILFNDRIKWRYYETIKRYSTVDIKNLYETTLNTKYINQSLLTYEILKDNKLFGVGNKNYFNSCIKLEKNLAIKCYTHPHQIYYEFLSEHGIIGSMIIIISLFMLLYKKNNLLTKSNTNLLFIFKIYCIISLIPLIPTGSFFSSYNMALFWINFSFFEIFKKIK
jgi:O-antigen ligase